MSLIETHQKLKEGIEKELNELLPQLINAGIEAQGGYKNRITLLEKLLKETNQKISNEAKQNIFEVAEPKENIRKIKMFLASSNELKNERDQFEIFINRENNNLINKNIFIRLIIWEDFLNVVSQTRIQDEYNKAIKECDLFIGLFYTKAGIFTEEEFDTALDQFHSNNRPYIFTYFKNISTNVNNITKEEENLLKFKNKLGQMGHFYTTFNDINDLKYQFKMQLEKILQLLKLN